MLRQPNPVSNSDIIEVLHFNEQSDHEQQKDNRCFLTKCFKFVVQHPIKTGIIAGAAVALAAGGGVYSMAPVITVALLNRNTVELPLVNYGYCNATRVNNNNKKTADFKCCKVDGNQTPRWALNEKSDAAQLQDPCSKYSLKGGTVGCNFETIVRYSENSEVSDRHMMRTYCLNNKKIGPLIVDTLS